MSLTGSPTKQLVEEEVHEGNLSNIASKKTMSCSKAPTFSGSSTKEMEALGLGFAKTDLSFSVGSAFGIRLLQLE
jgi:hypothetical protein